MKLLLINPKFPESFWSFRWVFDTIFPEKQTINPPLGLATISALCPDDWEVEIVDENIEPIPLNPRADIIGVCGMGAQFIRAKELLSFYKRKGYFVVAGGSYASLCPEAYQSLPDVVVAGEAEYTWREFCQDIEKGKTKRLYHETGVVSLEDSPVPRFELLKLSKYQAATLQFSRGCPFRCEFCDIIVMFGRKPRTKSFEQVGKELDVLRRLNVRKAFFVDDNLIGNKMKAKGLLGFLRDYQRRWNYRFHFGTEASLDVAHDSELLGLLHDANFEWLFVGIESPDEESLKETKKFQNMRQDVLSSVRKIYSYGIDVLGGFIIGFDNDTVEVFGKQYEFIMESGIQSAMVGLLTAVQRTPLYRRLEKEGRLLSHWNHSDNTKLGTNFIPKQMGYSEMVSGYRSLYLRLVEDRSIADRIINKIRYLTNPLYERDYSLGEKLEILWRLLAHGLIPGGFSRIFYFLRSLPFSKPRLFPLAIQDWIVGLSMRDYVDRHFGEESEETCDLAYSYLKLIEKAFRRYLRQGALEISLNEMKNAASNYSISLKGFLDRDFFNRAAHHLEGVLRGTRSSITLNIEELNEKQIRHLKRLLERLSQYGDRIYIVLHEELKHIINIDSSVFNLVLSPSG